MLRGTPRVWLMVFAFSILPLTAYAVDALPDRIVPCDGVGENGGKACSVCDLATLAQNLLNGGVFLAVVMSALLFSYAGWLYLSNEAIGEQQKARGLFKDVVIGLIIILGAWLFIDTLMKTLSGGNYMPWNSVCSGDWRPSDVF